jgi:hypothetical protein
VKAVNKGLYALLHADQQAQAQGTLGQLGVTGVSRRLADSKPPVVVFTKQSGGRSYTFGDNVVARDLVYAVKCIVDGESTDVAEDVIERVNELLTGTFWPLVGDTDWSMQSCRWESDVDYTEVVQGEPYHHIGGLFRISVMRTA